MSGIAKLLRSAVSRAADQRDIVLMIAVLNDTILACRDITGLSMPATMAGPCSEISGHWLPFLDTYRTMCRAPEPAFRRILEDIRELRFAA